MRGQPPFGFSMPFMMIQGPMPPQQGMGEAHPHFMPDAQVPARVKVAMEFMSMLQMKGMDRGTVGEGAGSVLELKGKEPNTNEANAEEAACELLAAYFRGKLEQDHWEKQRFDAVSKRIEKEHQPPPQGHLTGCPLCGGRMGIPCKLCKGAGKVLLQPLVDQGSFSSTPDEGPGMPANPMDLINMMMNGQMPPGMAGQGPEPEKPPEDRPGPESEGQDPEEPSDPKAGPEGGPSE